jgi:hypothetical protein
VLSARAVIELVYQDASGSTGAVTVHVPVTSTYAEADVSANALASVLASVTSCVLVRQRIKYTIVRDNPLPAAIGSSIKRQGALFFATSGTNPDAIVTIPGIISDVLVTDGPCANYCIQLSDSRVLGVLGALLDGSATNPFSDAIVTLVAGYVQSRV